MSSNKHALIRYKVLDRCFSNPGKEYTIDDLIEECCSVLEKLDPDTNGICLKTVRNDIAFMKSDQGWNIELGNYRHGQKMYYRYVNTNFSINNMPLNDLEINQLSEAMSILTQFKGMPQFEWVHELLPKLRQGIAPRKAIETVIEFDSNQYLKGIEHLGVLYNAIVYKKALICHYHPFDSETATDVCIHPHYLKQYNNRWFLFGYNPENGSYTWNLALDRIITIKDKKGKFVENTQIDWAEYHTDIIGVTKPDEGAVENITLHFFGKTSKYIESKPIHGSQKTKWIGDNILEANFQLIINYEFERLILSYADSIKVIKPNKLAVLIKKRLKEAYNLY